MARAAERESPELYLGLGQFWRRPKSDRAWACDDVLRRLFRTGHARRIVFVAKAKADASTYEVRLGEGLQARALEAPVEAPILLALRDWLRAQIAAGRPHIGVRILVEGRNS